MPVDNSDYLDPDAFSSPLNNGERIYNHWPDLIVTATYSVIYCDCGKRFQEQYNGAVIRKWASHVATELTTE